MRATKVLLLTLPGLVVAVPPALAHGSCSLSVTEVYTSPSGVYGKANASCSSQHDLSTLKVCVQYRRSDGSWKCVDSSLREQAYHNQAGYFEVTSGTVCNRSTRTYRIRGRFKAYNNTGELAHNLGPRFSSNTVTFTCPSTTAVDEPDLPVELDDYLP